MSILIALPCYGGLVSDKTTKGLFLLGKELRTHQIDHGLLMMSNESSITMGRSKIANFFINNTDFERILFIDADVGFSAVDVQKLLESNKDIVCGAYPMKVIPTRYNYDVKQPIVREGNLIQIDRIGFGFSLIHRKVFVDIAKRFGDELKYFPSLNNAIGHEVTEREYHNSYHFFHELKNGMRYYSEDYSFFERSRMVGYEVWLDTSITLSHVGSHVFEGGV